MQVNAEWANLGVFVRTAMGRGQFPPALHNLIYAT